MSLPEALLTEFNKELSLDGCGLNVLNDQIYISVDKITNNRNLFGFSGSLSLELWAIETPYKGEGFSGQLVTYTHLTQLQDGYELTNNTYQLPFSEPTAGTWHMTLMLREWDGANYITKDYVNFPIPYTVSQPMVIREVNNVISVDFTVNESPSAYPEKVSDDIGQSINHVEKENSEKPAANTDATQDAKLDSAVTDEQAVKQLQKTSNKLKEAKKNKTSEKNKKKIKVKKTVKISINSAAIEELESVKNLPKKVAKAIVDARPYKSFDELLKIKGMGPKLLKKVEVSIKL
ncbi:MULTISPECIES: helix-hairpin-helix domain-containing protein [unclassified Neptuniibacter]|uniref:ComEA family DNA-binding protein n=1 Tax=unclassified Neptuniibacter TaxID=2630693 RepID=UPI000C62C48F|nr:MULTISPECIES: helix-hairpin-helix domain-containing protein [unclassified Neptuniibacter]MAY42170.1 hypothetical protein [Oceanospirillaceae bacterium]|tara:strand:- start:22284 stop:23156 length:873 start_codon:yes stop_codon:yes gene_type:complete